MFSSTFGHSNTLLRTEGQASASPLISSGIASGSSAAGGCVRRSGVSWVMGDARTPEVDSAST